MVPRQLRAPHVHVISYASSSVVAQSWVSFSPGRISRMATNTICPCTPMFGSHEWLLKIVPLRSPLSPVRGEG